MIRASRFLGVLVVLLLSGQASAAPPILSGQLKAGAVQQFSANPVRGSTYNARIFGDYNYVTQINAPNASIARFPANGTAVVQESTQGSFEHRMNAPFSGDIPAYVLAAGGNSNANLSRYDFSNYANRSDVVAPSVADAVIVESFDWVDADTIIANSYSSGKRNNLYLMDIQADPFTATTNTTWNANGFVLTDTTTRIRNVRVGKSYTDYAYYGDASVLTNPNFYAINLATGTSSLLGNAGTLTGGGSHGLWTVVEAGGYLYVQTTDNGIQVYNMTSATGLGSLYTSYSKAEIDGLFGSPSAQYWGLDVSSDGSRMVLSGGNGSTYEMVPEPSSLVLATLGLLGCYGLVRVQRRRRMSAT